MAALAVRHVEVALGFITGADGKAGGGAEFQGLDAGNLTSPGSSSAGVSGQNGRSGERSVGGDPALSPENRLRCHREVRRLPVWQPSEQAIELCLASHFTLGGAGSSLEQRARNMWLVYAILSNL